MFTTKFYTNDQVSRSAYLQLQGEKYGFEPGGGVCVVEDPMPLMPWERSPIENTMLAVAREARQVYRGELRGPSDWITSDPVLAELFVAELKTAAEYPRNLDFSENDAACAKARAALEARKA
jgi:hypothetical protein